MIPDEEVLTNFFDEFPSVLDALDEGSLRISAHRGNVYFHITEKGAASGLRAFAEMVAFANHLDGGLRPLCPEGFDPKLPDDHPTNRAACKAFVTRREAEILVDKQCHAMQIGKTSTTATLSAESQPSLRKHAHGLNS